VVSAANSQLAQYFLRYSASKLMEASTDRGHTLIDAGVYPHTRHPRYAGLIAMAASPAGSSRVSGVHPPSTGEGGFWRLVRPKPFWPTIFGVSPSKAGREFYWNRFRPCP
jgi:hypothetical protein